MSSGLRPSFAARLRTSSRNSFMPEVWLAVAMIESACFAAKARRAAGLHVGRSSLRRRRGVERTAALEELPFEMDRMHLGVIGVNPARKIFNHRVRLPGVEQLVDKVHVFVGHGIARLARRERVHAEILGCEILAAGHDIPAE